jgi:hypothetical protein
MPHRGVTTEEALSESGPYSGHLDGGKVEENVLEESALWCPVKRRRLGETVEERQNYLRHGVDPP